MKKINELNNNHLMILIQIHSLFNNIGKYQGLSDYQVNYMLRLTKQKKVNFAEYGLVAIEELFYQKIYNAIESKSIYLNRIKSYDNIFNAIQFEVNQLNQLVLLYNELKETLKKYTSIFDKRRDFTQFIVSDDDSGNALLTKIKFNYNKKYDFFVTNDKVRTIELTSDFITESKTFNNFIDILDNLDELYDEQMLWWE